MNTPRRHLLRRLARQRKHGQSIPIIALMILILVAMVGLSVDVGNTFSKERQAVASANAASLAGMSAYMARSSSTLDTTIYQAITASLQSNGLVVGDGTNNTVEVTANYLDSQGNLLAGHPVVGSGGTAPNGAAYIRVQLSGMVNTSFARVVGRDDLPINADAHAGLCQVNSGVYPIAVDNAYIGNGVFNNIGVTNPSTEYKVLSNGMVQRRVYVRDGDDSPGQFGWLRWKEDKGELGQAAGSAGELAQSLTGDGNLDWGFDEAPWPSNETAPSDYPNNPHSINIGDWAWGNSGWSNSNAVTSAIDQHIANSTIMILPIYDRMVGSGNNASVRIVNFGSFIIVASGRDKNRPYFDMIYLGPPTRQYNVCSQMPPPPAETNLLDLAGNVSFYPEYQIIPTSQKPIQYVVVLDASGSMSANFDGQCNNSGGVKQCANGPSGFPDVQVSNTGYDYWWTTESQRRIYVAKKALERLVTLSNMPGNPGYTNTRPSDQMAVVWFNDGVSSSQTQAFTNNPTTLKNYITTLNNVNGNYRSAGGTNGAGGLYRASLLYQNAPKTVSFNGTNVEYKRVVLFVTDGVSNYFLNTSASDLKGPLSSYDTFKKNSTCYNMKSKVIESASCQTTEVGGKYTVSGKTYDRPVTQMILTSQNNLRNATINAEVFVIALSNIPATGLDTGVASSTNYFFAASSLQVNANGTTNVDQIIDTINAKVETGACVVGPSGTTNGKITSSEFGSNPSGFNYPQVGQVTITNDANSYTAPVLAADDGTLRYHFSSILPGTYRLQAFIYYRHPLDPAGVSARLYGNLFSAGTSAQDMTVYVTPDQTTNNSNRIELPLTLKLTGNVCPTN
ncbi:von Willebrand factor type A [Oscillochloris trichoides DG-6]|uniref:von Willebrand factor type A n=1 Tax=Oscillochloris trichoides DG-6 TaxID=765420 RepID=E1IHG6_9CHLR|nr:VWA domain-containing protein [Oscillochloris trichoides]EFO79372.1 von Willebrand factor type A [Oscillochloris trichoides DG-6]